MNDLTVLFFHHADDPLTRHHHDSLVRHNPGVPIIPIHRGEMRHLPGAIDTYCADDAWSEESNWFGADIALLHWFMNRPSDSQRYIFMEYDCLVTTDLRQWYEDVWDADAVGSRLKHPGDDYGWWASMLHKLPANHRPHAVAASPLNGIMLSHRALQAVTRSAYPVDVFAEIRLPTAVQAAGLDVVEMSPAKSAINLYVPTQVTNNEPRLWHPIKSLAEGTRPNDAEQIGDDCAA